MVKNSEIEMGIDPLTESRLRRFLRREFAESLTMEDLSCRLENLGYRIAERSGVKMLTTLPHGKPLCPAARVGLPARFAQ